MCAPSHERRLALRRACAGVAWEVVAAVEGVDEALARVSALRAQALVVDAGVAPPGDLAARLVAVRDGTSLIGVGPVPGAAAMVAHDDLTALPRALAATLHAADDHRH